MTDKIKALILQIRENCPIDTDEVMQNPIYDTDGLSYDEVDEAFCYAEDMYSGYDEWSEKTIGGLEWTAE